MDNRTIEDPVFDKIAEITSKDREIAEDFVNSVVDILREKLSNNDNDFEVKHGFLGLSKCIISLSQILCDDEEQYMSEINLAQSVAIDRVMPSILPKINEEGKSIEENYDTENLSIRRLMMTVGTLIDYIFWRTEVSKYSKTREELEKEELLKSSLEKAEEQ